MRLQDLLLYGVEGVAIVLAILDFMGKTETLEKRVRLAMEVVEERINRNPVKEYIKAGFKTSSEYALGVLLGGVVFVFLSYAFGGDDIHSILFALVLLYLVCSRKLPSARHRTGVIFGVVMLLLVNRSGSSSGTGILILMVATVILVACQVFGPVFLAGVIYLLLFSLHRTLAVLSKPKKGIVGTVSLLLAIGLPVGSLVFQ